MDKVLIVDDEELSRQSIKISLTNIFSSKNRKLEIYEVDNTQDARIIIKDKKPDIVLLDIGMPHENGISFLAKQKSIPYEVIIITAYHEYAIEAFKHHAQDYLLKPFLQNDLEVAIDKCFKMKQLKNKAKKYTYLNEMLQNSTNKKIAVPIQDGLQIIDLDSIYYIKAAGSYVDIFFNDSKLGVSKNLKYFENILPPSLFIRVHDSYIVNKNKIKNYVKGSGGYLILDNNTQIEVSKRRKEGLIRILYNE